MLTVERVPGGVVVVVLVGTRALGPRCSHSPRGACGVVNWGPERRQESRQKERVKVRQAGATCLVVATALGISGRRRWRMTKLKIHKPRALLVVELAQVSASGR